MVIRPEPLTREAFRPFGDVIETAGRASQMINEGNTEKFPELAQLIAGKQADLAVHVFRARPQKPPIAIRRMERHPLGSQAFMPLHDRPFPVVVAGPGPAPRADQVRAFLSNGRQGVNLHPGTWHHYLLSLEEVSDYLVIDREEEGGYFEQAEIPGLLFLQL